MRPIQWWSGVAPLLPADVEKVVLEGYVADEASCRGSLLYCSLTKGDVMHDQGQTQSYRLDGVAISRLLYKAWSVIILPHPLSDILEARSRKLI